MSEIRANSITDAAGTGAPNFPNGLDVAGATLSSIATQAQAQAGTDNTTLMTPLRAAQAIAALAGGLDTIDARTTSGSFTVPAGVTQLYVYAAGGGGGGGASGGSFAAGSGGVGGTAWSVLTVSPGDSISYTVGAGGAGGQFSPAAGAAGGTTTVGTISCTGGAGGGGTSGGSAGVSGAAGSGSGGNIANSRSFSAIVGYLLIAPLFIETIINLRAQGSGRSYLPYSPTGYVAIAYSQAGSFAAGASGQGGLGSVHGYGAGGVGGVVMFMY